ncbi:MAG: hypothetical protein RLY58_1507 [Pseudomonadota bacterium]|jgi:arsenate reductase
MTATIYGIKACDSMKKAFALLDELAVGYEFHDYKKHGIDADILSGWVAQLGLDAVLNRRGTTWRKLTEDQKAQADSMAGAIALMQAQPSMIKRPMLCHQGQLMAGFDADAYRQQFARP